MEAQVGDGILTIEALTTRYAENQGLDAKSPSNFSITYSWQTIERIRDYLVQQIRALRSPSADAQFLQQYALLPFKEVQAFLARYQPRLAAEIIQAYSNTMRWYYVTAFRRYRHALQKDGSSLVKEHETVGMEMPLSKGE